jgi:pilus assembly protein CpaF
LKEGVVLHQMNDDVYIPFRGLPSSSKILQERQREAVEGFDVEEIMEQARAHVLKLLRNSKQESEIEKEIHHLVDQECPNMTHQQKAEISQEILDELRGYGPIAELMDDPDVSEIVIISYKRILYEKQGTFYEFRKEEKPVTFRSVGHLRLLIERFCMMGYGRADESQPFSVINVEGMRINITVPPVSPVPTLAIRKFVSVPTLEELIRWECITEEAAQFLKACVVGRRNIAIAGGMGTGKTTTIGILGRHFNPDEFPVLVEAVRECPLEHPNLRVLVGRPPNVEGKGEITLSPLLRNALTMRASRVLVSEAKGGEVFYCLQAMNIGHDGSMFTFHGNNAEEAITVRLPMMVAMSDELKGQVEAAKYFIGCSLHLVCVLEIAEGKRRYKEIAEVQYKDGQLRTVPIFVRDGSEFCAVGKLSDAQLEQMVSYGAEVPACVLGNSQSDITF